jgi:hypothetical protein
MLALWVVLGLSCSSPNVTSEREISLLVSGRLEGEIEPCG